MNFLYKMTSSPPKKFPFYLWFGLTDTPHPHPLNILVHALAWLVITIRVARRSSPTWSPPSVPVCALWVPLPPEPASPGPSWHHHLSSRLMNQKSERRQKKSLFPNSYTTFLSYYKAKHFHCILYATIFRMLLFYGCTEVKENTILHLCFRLLFTKNSPYLFHFHDSVR